MKTSKKLISLLLCIVMILSVCPTAFAADGVYTNCDGKDDCPAIIIPGLFQCEAFAYDESGEKMLDSKGNVRTSPFFLDTSDIIKNAIKEVVAPLASTLITQKDSGQKLAKALGKVLGEALLGVAKCDENGQLVNDVRAAYYESSMATMSEHDTEWALNAIPLQNYINSVGADHLYFYSYYSLDNLTKLATELRDLIEQVKRETGHDKVNVTPISQGGSIFDMALALYPEIVDSIDRVVYIVPAADGSNTLGDFYTTGLLDDDDALYGYMFPLLIKAIGNENDWLGYLINTLIRLFPKKDLNNILDTIVDILIRDYLSYSTAMWALVPSDHYPEAREKYLNDEKHAEIRKQADEYYKVQLETKNNILKAREKGVTFFDICGYNTDLYPIVDSWNKVLADGIIQVSSTSFGATGIKKDTELPEGYVQQNTSPTCTDPTHNHIDPYNLLDASTGLLPDHTFYFYNLNHALTGFCDVIIDLAVQLLTDESFKDVYSYPDKWPQFNNFRNSRDLIAAVEKLKGIDTDSLSAEDAAQVKAAIADAEQVLSETVVDTEKFEAAAAQVDSVTNTVLSRLNSDYAENLKNESLKSKLIKVLSKILSIVNAVLRKFVGDKGFFDK